MTLSPLYQDFGGLQTPSDPPKAQNEEAALKSFEDGYQAGWEDAIKAQADTQSAIREEFAQSLQDMSFTYHEALFKLTSGMQPLMTELLEKLLPAVAKGALVAHLSEQLETLVKDMAEQPIEIVTSPENQIAIESLMPEGHDHPFRPSFDPTLSPGQAFLKIGQSERSIDLDQVIQGIETAMSAYFFEMEQKQKHG
jgi:flagellar assembly protein FliH